MEQLAVPQSKEQATNIQTATSSNNIATQTSENTQLSKNSALQGANNPVDTAKTSLTGNASTAKALTLDQLALKTDVKSATNNQSSNPVTTAADSGSASSAAAKPPEMMPSLNYLQRAFNKLGAVPRTELHTMELRPNVASELLKLLPALQPKPLGSLALPEVLQAELTAQLAFQPAVPVTTPNATQTDAISTLLQLLIGAKAFSQQLNISPKLRQYLQALQSRTGIGSALLQTLNEHDSLEHVSRMMQGIRVYQQAGSAENGSQSWYATLPYYLDQRQEQLEAKFDHSDAKQQGAGKRQQWQLQLKFNLNSGALLAKAQIQEQGVNLHFIGSSQRLIDKVNNHLELLGKKLTQLGLVPTEISAHVAPVPATLLPGDHYLVHIKA